MSPTLPGFVAVFLLAFACSRRVPALRTVAAAFAAWAILDAATGPLWLRAGVCVAWPGVAVVAAAWGLGGDRRHDRERERHEQDRGASATRCFERVRWRLVLEDATKAERAATGQAWFVHRANVVIALAAVYLLAGCVTALSYRAHAPDFYHLALPLSRLSTVPFAAHALLTRPWSRPWATRAAVTPLLGLACGVVLGVWTLLPALESVREQWGRLAGAETWATMAGVAVCVVGAWWEARADRP